MKVGASDFCSYYEDVTKAHVLVVDDEPNLLEMISDCLVLAGHDVELASDGFQAHQLMRSQSFDLLVTDVNMPKMDGYELVDRLRKAGDDTPVIFLTARNDRPDVAKGFRIGADDYITKPFGIEEFSLRVTALLRRTLADRDEDETLHCGLLTLADASHSVTLDGEAVDLSPTEFRLLQYLMENKNKVLTKHALLDRIWGINFNDSATVVDTYISYLRKKLHTQDFEPIKTVRGVGFMISDRK